MMHTQRLFAASVVAASLLCVPVHAQQAFTAEQLLDRSSAYVENLVAKLSRVVAEEQYMQEYLLSSPEGSRGGFLGTPKVAERRTLKSDLLLVKPAGLDQWFVFRDVFEVDARPVRDRENRLSKMFLEARDAVTAIERAHEIAVASAQFNIRDMGTVDNPMLAVGLLQRVYRPRFRFTLRERDASAGPDVWIVEFRETARPTLMRGTGNKDIFARGRFWVEAATGRVARSELIFSALGTDSTITTAFEMDDRLGTPVPVEMRFKRGAPKNEVRGVATYGRFRQFEVGTEESLK
ncbi:MAG TPA: hypothetical protein VM115_06555 [Vicinamibacterales bacterium]|nr:hypothetical protein [Vicinamibacterales bacterium]